MGIMVETSLSNLYHYYNNMKYYGHYAISEIDSMLPFERDIYLGLLQKTIEENNKRNN